MERYDLAVYIGRFQPFHKAHLEIVKRAMEMADHLLIVIGSRNKGRRTFKNPWTWDERKEMILRGLEKSGVVTHRVHIVSVFDVPGDDEAWREQVHDAIDHIIHDKIENCIDEDQPDPKVTLIGYEKDASSYYLQTFPRLVYSPVTVPEIVSKLNATDIRKMMINGIPYWTMEVPDGTKEFLQDWLRTHDLDKVLTT